MTLSANPTFVCKDKSSQSFAVTIKPRSGAPPFDSKPFKKGYTMVVSNARIHGIEGGKQGFISTTPEHVKVNLQYTTGTPAKFHHQVIPASLEKLLSMHLSDYTFDPARCQTCRSVGEGMLKCKGCQEVAYCDKVSEIQECHKDSCLVSVYKPEN